MPSISLLGRISGESLMARVARGGISIALASAFDQLLRLARNVVLARILLPEAFGAVALVFTVVTLLDSLSQMGVREAVVQSPDAENPAYLNGAWYLSLARGAVLCAAGILLAPLASRFFGRQELAPMLRVASLALLVQGAVSARSYVALKRLQTAKWALAEQLGGFLGLSLSVLLSLVWRNAWGLVVGSLADAISRTALSFVFFPHAPRWRFQREHLRGLLRYSRRMLGIPVLTYVFMQIDLFVVGRTQTAEIVGLYAVAAALSRLPDALLSRFAAPLMVPAYASVQHEPGRIVPSISIVIRSLGLVAGPIVAAGLLHGELVMSILYTERYSGVGLVFGLLLGASALRNLSVPFASICLATDRADALRRVTLLRAIAVAVLVYPATLWLGVAGAAASVLLASAIAFVAQGPQLNSMFGRAASLALRQVFWGVAFSAPVVTLWPVVRLLKDHSSASAAIVAAASVLVSYGAYGLLIRLRKRASSRRSSRIRPDGSQQ